jgi:hypothetical protein
LKVLALKISIVMIHRCIPTKWRGLKHIGVPTKCETSIRKVEPANLGVVTVTHGTILMQAKLLTC